MAIRFACPNCSSVFTVAEDAAGKRAKCNKCGGSLIVPTANQSAGKPRAAPPSEDDFDAGVTMRPRHPLRAQPPAPGGDEFDLGATLAPKRPTPPRQDDFDHGATMPRAKPDTAGSHAQADTRQNRTDHAPASDLPLGSEVDGRYLVMAKLGQGGMGAVYKVVDKDTQTEFALKVLAPDLVGSPEALADLKKEVAIAQQLTHQNLLRVNYLGCTPQLAYLLMEFIDGEDLETYRLRQGGKVSADDFRRLMPQLLQGLEYLHNKGIVHLDLKPRNIMVSKTGELKLTDFGVSRSIKEQVSRRNQEQDLVGTLCYMAPEQIRKQVCDRRADIYAVGLVFCQLLIGRLPFPGGDPKAVVAWHLGPDPDLSKFPAEWRPLLQKCLARDPTKRFAACKEMLSFFEGASLATAIDDIFGDAPSPGEQQFRRAVAQAFAKGDPAPQQRESLRLLMQQLGIAADAAKRIVEEHKAGKAGAASRNNETENLRILLEAGQYKDAASLARNILAHDAQNALAWAAKGSEAIDVHEMLKCFEMADRFGPNDPSVAKEKLRLARHHFDNASRQFDLFARLDYDADRHNSCAFEFLQSVGATITLAPNLTVEVMKMVVEACTGAIEQAGWYFNTNALREILGDRIVSEYFVEASARPGCTEPRAFAAKQRTSGNGASTLVSREQFPSVPQRSPTSGVLIAIVSGLLFGIGMGVFAAIKQGPETGLGAAVFCALSFGPIMGFLLRGVRIAVGCQDRDQLAGYISGLLVGMKYMLAEESRGCLEFQHTNGGMFPQWAAVSVYFQTGTAVIVGPAWYVNKLKRRLPKAPAPVRQGPSFGELASRGLRKCVDAVLSIDSWLGRMLGEENAILHKFLRVLLIGVVGVIAIWIVSLVWQFASSEKPQDKNTFVAETPVDGVGEPGEAKTPRSGTTNSRESESRDHLQRAEKYRDARDFDKAITEYDKVLAIEANNVAAYRGRALAYMEKKNWDHAIADATKAIQHDSQDAVAYAIRGRAHSNKNEPDEAIADCTEAIRLDPKNAPAYRGRGAAYLTKKDYKQAVTDEDEAIRLDPRDAKAYRLRGLAYDGEGDSDRAIADYTEAIRLDPKDDVAYMNRGAAHHKKGNFDEAIADCTEAIRLDPKDAGAYSNRGLSYHKKGNSDQAIADCAEAIRLDPKNPGFYVNRAIALNGKSRSAEAVRDCSEAIRLDPNLARAYTLRAGVFFGQDELDRAIADCTEAIHLDPNDSGAYLIRATAYISKRSFDNAISDCSAAIRLKPNDSDLLFLRGFAYTQKREFENAIADLSEVIRLDPNHAKAYYARGGAYANIGDSDKAIADCTAAIRLDPKDAQAYYCRAGAYVNKGDPDSAIADCTEAIRLDPKLAQAYYVRGVSYKSKGLTSKAEKDFSRARVLGATVPE